MNRAPNKLHYDTIEEWYKKYTLTYLLLIRNAAAKRAEVRKQVLANGNDIDEAMKTYRRYLGIIDYLFERIEREKK
jgi:hypothetical protein